MESPTGMSVPQHEGWDTDVLPLMRIFLNSVLLLPIRNKTKHIITSGEVGVMSWSDPASVEHCSQLTVQPHRLEAISDHILEVVATEILS